MPPLPPLRIAVAQPAQAAEISRLAQGLAHCFVDVSDGAEGLAARPFLSTFEPEAIGALLANPTYRYHVATAGELQPQGNP